jgi:hypothetical protein
MARPGPGMPPAWQINQLALSTCPRAFNSAHADGGNIINWHLLAIGTFLLQSQRTHSQSQAICLYPALHCKMGCNGAACLVPPRCSKRYVLGAAASYAAAGRPLRVLLCLALLHAVPVRLLLDEGVAGCTHYVRESARAASLCFLLVHHVRMERLHTGRRPGLSSNKSPAQQLSALNSVLQHSSLAAYTPQPAGQSGAGAPLGSGPACDARQQLSSQLPSCEGRRHTPAGRGTRRLRSDAPRLQVGSLAFSTQVPAT